MYILEISTRLSRLNISGPFPECINSNESFLLRTPAPPHTITRRVLTVDFPDSLELHSIKNLKPVNTAKCLLSRPDQIQSQVNLLRLDKVGVDKKRPTLRQVISLLKLDLHEVIATVNHQRQNCVKCTLCDGDPALDRAC